MKKLTIPLLICLLLSFIGFSQEENITYAEYSYTELFKMIEEEQDSVFKLNNAIIEFIPEIDTLYSKEGNRVESNFARTDTIYINKELQFENVQFNNTFRFDKDAVLNHIVFNEKVTFSNSIIGNLEHCVFKKHLYIELDSQMHRILERLNDVYGIYYISNCQFLEGVTYFSNVREEEHLPIWLEIKDSEIHQRSRKGPNKFLLFQTPSQDGFLLKNNTFYGEGRTMILSLVTEILHLDDNNFKDQAPMITIAKKVSDLSITKNSFNRPVWLNVENLSENYNIGWDQFKLGIIDYNYYMDYYFEVVKINPTTNEVYHIDDIISSNVYEKYLNIDRTEDQGLYKNQIKMYGKFHNLYKAQFDNQYANQVYVEMKDLETDRLAYLNAQNPNFKTFFTWKVNQFLKVFSAYGTEPARSIIFSVYVILLFALIYLFFPNSWDKHGKNRIVDRYNFFFKYMRRKAGIHEVYLEEQQEEIMSYDQFKENITNST